MGDRLLEHEELLRELAAVQDWPLPKRMKWAKRRRKEQFRHWKRWIETDEAQSKCARPRKNSNPPDLKFASEIVLLEASARNDVDEGKKAIENNENRSFQFFSSNRFPGRRSRSESDEYRRSNSAASSKKLIVFSPRPPRGFARVS